jgi:hypothetical protein
MRRQEVIILTLNLDSRALVLIDEMDECGVATFGLFIACKLCQENVVLLICLGGE